MQPVRVEFKTDIRILKVRYLTFVLIVRVQKIYIFTISSLSLKVEQSGLTKATFYRKAKEYEAQKTAN